MLRSSTACITLGWDHLTEWLCDNLRFLRIIEEDILTVTVVSITNVRSCLDYECSQSRRTIQIVRRSTFSSAASLQVLVRLSTQEAEGDSDVRSDAAATRVAMRGAGLWQVYEPSQLRMLMS